MFLFRKISKLCDFNILTVWYNRNDTLCLSSMHLLRLHHLLTIYLEHFPLQMPLGGSALQNARMIYKVYFCHHR